MQVLLTDNYLGIYCTFLRKHEEGNLEIHSKLVIYNTNTCRGQMKQCVVDMYLSLFFKSVVSTLQLLHLLLGRVVFSHVGTFCGNGLQRAAVTQHFLIKKLQ